MAVTIAKSAVHYVGLSSDTKPTDSVSALSTFEESDTGNLYDYDGTSWNISRTGTAAHVTDGALASGPIYQDATYKYFGDAVPGTALTAATWRVSRMRISDSYVQWADGNGNFDNVYTSLAVVAALTFL